MDDLVGMGGFLEEKACFLRGMNLEELELGDEMVELAHP